MIKALKVIAVFLAIFAFSYGAVASVSNIKSEVITLENGLKVVLIPNTKVSAVSHMVWYKVGSADEQPGKTGLAHFLEHMMFKGTSKYKDGEFSAIVAKSGGNDNAFTSSDYTAYYQNISKNKLEMVMELESDRMRNLVLDDEAVLKERDVVLEERRSRTDNVPRALLIERMNAALYLNHPYRVPVIGWYSEITKLNKKDAKEFYDKHYTPSNAVLVVSGDVTMDELKPLAEKYYGSIQPYPAPKRISLKEPPHISKTDISLKDEKVTQPEWIRYYIAPSQNYGIKDFCYPLAVLSQILGGTDTSRLYQKLIVQKESAASVDSSYDDLSLGPTSFNIYAVPTEKSSLDEIEKDIEEEIANIVKNGVAEEELNRAKNSMIADVIYAQEDLKSLAYTFGEVFATGLDAGYVENWEKNISSVTSDQIKRAAKEILIEERSVTGRLLPKNKEAAE